MPFFKELMMRGAEFLPVTDNRMTRFWISLEKGVDFVLSSLTMMQGGEIFVPKVPSMKVVDLAHAIAPHAALKEVGIRPGEKLHEILITADDARNTFELPDRYMVAPAIGRWWTQDYYDKIGAKLVAEDFAYASNTNSHWLDTTELLRLLAN